MRGLPDRVPRGVGTHHKMVVGTAGYAEEVNLDFSSAIRCGVRMD